MEQVGPNESFTPTGGIPAIPKREAKRWGVFEVCSKLSTSESRNSGFDERCDSVSMCWVGLIPGSDRVVKTLQGLAIYPAESDHPKT